MAAPISPLYEKIPQKNTLHRALEFTIFFLLLSLLAYRLLSLKNNGFAWLIAFLCESWFTFLWVLNLSSKWNPVSYITYPERLLQCYQVDELPPVDMFVTTTDPMLEPPIITVNTVLSLLALDYPANKLSCYVSDDGASRLTFYSLLEASKFAKLWERYEELGQKIEGATLKSMPYELSSAEFVAFSNVERENHPTIIKTRVSGVMTNAPFMRNVDCDMYANNPQIFHHAMCLLLGSKNEQDCGFVQTPQCHAPRPTPRA
ncbi:Cellulose synthase-like protein B3 [Vitis vinifera]|uniref:Cellulose synthase-like protein B3 n=1 Tax=Vitis vinifera TaxID=29760 RepID=A0A438DTP5_VITVI|nr:Cellulose synthase-like protein B3 [Vitis vinifera]